MLIAVVANCITRTLHYSSMVDVCTIFETEWIHPEPSLTYKVIGCSCNIATMHQWLLAKRREAPLMLIAVVAYCITRTLHYSSMVDICTICETRWMHSEPSLTYKVIGCSCNIATMHQWLLAYRREAPLTVIDVVAYCITRTLHYSSTVDICTIFENQWIHPGLSLNYKVIGCSCNVATMHQWLLA